MVLLADIDFTLPFKDPVIVFTLVLLIILLAPLVFARLKIPSLIGLILAGVLIGPYGFNLLQRNSSIVLFGTVGLLYIMFTAGLEIDLEEFKKSRIKSGVFGFITFLVPMILGTPAAYYILGFNIGSSVLLASMFAAHTLLAYPIASKYGLSRIRSVTMTIGGTIVADVMSLLVLAAVTGMAKGSITVGFWIQLIISTLVFGCIVFIAFPWIARIFFKRVADPIVQYLFVLSLVFLGSFLAEVAGLESIIGAFLAGLALNRFIPHASSLMSRIDFVGNAFFIPFFLISVGMLVDFKVLLHGWGALRVAAVMTVMAIATKYIAAWLTQKSFHLSSDERQMIFGLSTARVGATLAVVLVGYNLILGETENGEPIRLLSEDVLNGTILMILVTCTISSFTVEKASRKLAIQEESAPLTTTSDHPNHVLIPMGPNIPIADLIDLLTVSTHAKKPIVVHGLHVVEDQSDASLSTARKWAEKAVKQAAVLDQVLVPIIRYDVNISNGMIYAMKEHNIEEVVLPASMAIQPTQPGYSTLVNQVLEKNSKQVTIYRAAQPLNTLQRIIAVLPQYAEHEQGFSNWFDKISTMSRETGMSLMIYAPSPVWQKMLQLNQMQVSPVRLSFQEFTDWDEFLIFSREVKGDDLFLILSSRKRHVSYTRQLEKLPYYLNKYFSANSFLIIFPEQWPGDGEETFEGPA